MPPRLKLAPKQAKTGDIYGIDRARSFVEEESRRFRELRSAKIIEEVSRVYLRYRTFKLFVINRYHTELFYQRKYYDFMYVIWAVRRLRTRVVLAPYFDEWSLASRKARTAVEFSRRKLAQRAFCALASESAAFIPNYQRDYSEIVMAFQKKIQIYYSKMTLLFIHLRVKFLKSFYAGYAPAKIFNEIKRQYAVPPEFLRYCTNLSRIEQNFAIILSISNRKMQLKPAFYEWFTLTWRQGRQRINEKFSRRSAIWLYGQYFHQWAMHIKIKTLRKRYYFKIWQNYIGTYVDEALRLRYSNKFEQQHYKAWCFQAWKRYVFASSFVVTGKILKNLTGPSANFQCFDEDGKPVKDEPLVLKRRSNMVIFFVTMNDVRYKPIATAIKCLFGWKQLPKERKSFNRFTLLMFGAFNVVKIKVKFRLWQYYARECGNGRIMNIEQDYEDDAQLFDLEFIQRVYDNVLQEVLTEEVIRSLISLVRSSAGHGLLVLHQNEKIESETNALLHKYKRLILTLNEEEIEESVSSIFARGAAGPFLLFFWRVVLELLTQRRRDVDMEREEYEKELIRAHMDEQQLESNYTFQLKSVEKLLSRRYLNYLVAVEENFSDEIETTESCQQQLVQIFSEKNPDLANYIEHIEGISFSLPHAAFESAAISELVASDVPLEYTTYRIAKYFEFSLEIVRSTFPFFANFGFYSSNSLEQPSSERTRRTKNTKRAVVSEALKTKFPEREKYQQTKRPQEWLTGTLTACLSHEAAGISSSRTVVIQRQLERVSKHSTEESCLISYEELGRSLSSSLNDELSEVAVKRADEYVLRAFNYDSADEQSFINEVMRQQASFIGDEFIDINEQLQTSNLRKMQLSKQRAERDFEFLKKSKEQKERDKSQYELYEKKKKLLKHLHSSRGVGAASIDKLANISNEDELRQFVKNEMAHGQEIDIDEDFWKEIMSERIKDELWTRNDEDFADMLPVEMSDSHTRSPGRQQPEHSSSQSGRALSSDRTESEVSQQKFSSQTELLRSTTEESTSTHRPKKRILQKPSLASRKATSANKSEASSSGSLEIEKENILLNAQGTVHPKVLRGNKLPTGIPQKLENAINVEKKPDLSAAEHEEQDRLSKKQADMAHMSGGNVPFQLDGFDSEEIRQIPSKLDMLAAERKIEGRPVGGIVSQTSALLETFPTANDDVGLAVAELLLQNDDINLNSSSEELPDYKLLESEIAQFKGKTEAEIKDIIRETLRTSEFAEEDELIEQQMEDLALKQELLERAAQKAEERKEQAEKLGISVDELIADEVAQKKDKTQKVIEQIMQQTGTSYEEAEQLIKEEKKQLNEARATNLKNAVSFVEKLNQFTVLEDIVADEVDTDNTGHPILDRHLSRVNILSSAVGRRQNSKEASLRPFGELESITDYKNELELTRAESEEAKRSAIQEILFASDQDTELQFNSLANNTSATSYAFKRPPKAPKFKKKGDSSMPDAIHGESFECNSNDESPSTFEESSDAVVQESSGKNASIASGEENGRSLKQEIEKTPNTALASEPTSQISGSAINEEHLIEQIPGSYVQSSTGHSSKSQQKVVHNELCDNLHENIDYDGIIQHDYNPKLVNSREADEAGGSNRITRNNAMQDGLAEIVPLPEGEYSYEVDAYGKHSIAISGAEHEESSDYLLDENAFDNGNKPNFIAEKIEEYRASKSGSRGVSREQIESSMTELRVNGLLGIKEFDIMLKRATSAPETYYRIVRPLQGMELRPFSAVVARDVRVKTGDYGIVNSRVVAPKGSLEDLSEERYDMSDGITDDEKGNANSETSQRPESSAYTEVWFSHVPEALIQKKMAIEEHTPEYREICQRAKEKQTLIGKNLEKIAADTTQILNELIAERDEGKATGKESGRKNGFRQKQNPRGKTPPVNGISVVDIVYTKEEIKEGIENESELETDIIVEEDLGSKRNIFNDFDKLFARVGVSKLQDIVAERHQELMRVIEQESTEDAFTKELSELANKMMRKEAKKMKKQREKLEKTEEKETEAPLDENPLLLSESGAEEIELPQSDDEDADWSKVDASSLLKRTKVNPNYVVFKGADLSQRGVTWQSPLLDPSPVIHSRIANPHATLRFPTDSKYARPLLVLKTQDLPGLPGFETRIMSRVPISECDVDIVQSFNSRIQAKTEQEERILGISKLQK